MGLMAGGGWRNQSAWEDLKLGVICFNKRCQEFEFRILDVFRVTFDVEILLPRAVSLAEVMGEAQKDF